MQQKYFQATGNVLEHRVFVVRLAYTISHSK